MSHKLSKIIILVFLLAFPLVSFTLPSLPVFASGEGGGGNVDPTISHIIIDNAGIHYPTSADQNTAKFANNTLTLDNYNGGPIEISSDNDVTIMLKGNNTITRSVGEDSRDAILSRTNLTIDGDGSLAIVQERYGVAIELSYENKLTIKNGKIDIIIKEESGSDNIGLEADIIIIDGGEITINAANPRDEKDSFRSSVMIINNGTIKSNMGITNELFFIQNGGRLDITTTQDEAIEAYGIVAFNGGVANLEGRFASLDMMSESSLEELNAYVSELEEIYNISLPKNDSYFTFNGGDITMSGSDIAIIVFGEEEGISSIIPADWAIKLAKGTIIEPSAAVPTTFMLFAADEIDDKPAAYAAAFSDGTGDITYNEEDEVIEHAAKKVHLYKASVPATDDEENPNTLDTKIIALAFGTLFAIIAEGTIIADLYRRLFGIKKEVATIDQEMAKSETEPEPTPETPSDPEIPVPQA